MIKSLGEEKRQFLQFMLQNSVLKGRKIDFTLQTTFQQPLEYTERQAWLRLMEGVRTIIYIPYHDDQLQSLEQFYLDH